MKAFCERYGVTRAGYYAWRRRETSRHDRQDERLVARIRAIFEVSEGTYGSPRIHAALVQAGWPVGRKRVARLMREAGLKARSARIYRRTAGTHPRLPGFCGPSPWSPQSQGGGQSGRRESNSYFELGRLTCSRYTTPACVGG